MSTPHVLRNPRSTVSTSGARGALAVALALLVAAGLVVDAVVHLRLAHDYQLASPGGIGGGNLFRIEAVLAIVAAAYVVLRRSRPAFALAAMVALGGLAAVLLYRYVDVPALGPIPSMYEPIWFFSKSLSAVAEAASGVLALVGLLATAPPLRLADIVMTRRLLMPVALAAAAMALTGCGSASSSSQSSSGDDGGTGSMAGMQGMTADDMAQQAGKPSVAAREVCSDEIRTAVRHTLLLAADPAATSSFAHGRFHCDYAVPGGTLHLTVNDSPRIQPGNAWFSRLRSASAGARPIKGVEGLGFPAFQTQTTVAFLKDGKTLVVQAADVPRRDLPAGVSRQEVAYGVAAAVLACWTEAD